MSVTSRKLSVVLRATSGEGVGRYDDDAFDESRSAKFDGVVVSLTQLRRYAGEVYSMAWDAAFGLDERERSSDDDSIDDDDDVYENEKIATGGRLLDLIVYPQNMPNSPPEGWIDLRPDLSCVCSHDSITGWVTSSGISTRGGLRDHVDAVNAERSSRGLGLLEALHVNDWPDGAEVTGDPNVVFLEDDDAFDKMSSSSIEKKRRKSSTDNDIDTEMDGSIGPGGTAIPPSSLYSSVCVGGTFDGMHYGHRKLLTLAVSSVQPVSGRLLIGVTRDEMLQHKAFADRIPPLEERIAGVLDFVGNLAPGMKNRIRCIPISDEYGPPGQPMNSKVYPGLMNDFDALVLSHETLPTGRKLNMYRENMLGLRPLKLLCTQRTEPHGMSSTALRRMRTTKQ
jgi:cytidyltransferase-like protein